LSVGILEIDRRPTLRPSVEYRILDDMSSVVADSAAGDAHALTPVGTAILERCDGTMTVGEIIDAIVEIFDCTPDQAERDVIAFLDELAAKGLIDR
jgi:PqqD family protein of HPr-rel-A system